MSGVLLTALWVHDAADLSDYATLRFLNESEQWPAATEVRRYAGGRMRSVSTPGISRAVPLTLKRVMRADYDALRDLVLVDEAASRLVMIRLPRGRKLWGVISDLTAVERTSFDLIDVAFTVQEVTVDEAV